MGIFSDVWYIKALLLYMFIPVVLVCIGLSFYAFHIYYKNRINVTFAIKRKIKLILNVVGILLLGALFILMIGFVIAFALIMNSSDFTNKFVYYILIASPLLPCVFMFNFVLNFFKNLRSEEEEVKIDKDEKFDIDQIEKFDVDQEEKLDLDTEENKALNSTESDDEELEVI